MKELFAGMFEKDSRQGLLMEDSLYQKSYTIETYESEGDRKIHRRQVIDLLGQRFACSFIN
jgi:hypothetical protein